MDREPAPAKLPNEKTRKSRAVLKETYWSRFADDFEERNIYVVGKENIEAIQKALADLAVSGKVLELGCGNGTYSKTLAQTAKQVFATDFSDEMVATSTKQLKSFDNILVKKENCFSLSFSDATFDCVVMINLLHVIAEPEKAIRESKRVLKNNGDIIIVGFTTENLSFLSKLGIIYRYLKTYGKPPKTAQALPLQKACSLLENNNFTVKDARLIGNSVKAICIKATFRCSD